MDSRRELAFVVRALQFVAFAYEGSSGIDAKILECGMADLDSQRLEDAELAATMYATAENVLVRYRFISVRRYGGHRHVSMHALTREILRSLFAPVLLDRCRQLILATWGLAAYCYVAREGSPASWGIFIWRMAQLVCSFTSTDEFSTTYDGRIYYVAPDMKRYRPLPIVGTETSYKTIGWGEVDGIERWTSLGPTLTTYVWLVVEEQRRSALLVHFGETVTLDEVRAMREAEALRQNIDINQLSLLPSELGK